ncbi:MAG: ATP-binding protein [Sphingobacteriales bacterium]
MKYFKRLIFTLFLTLTVPQLYAQACIGCNIDSLYKQVDKKKTDIEKVKALQQVVLSIFYYGGGGFSSAITPLDRLITLNKKTNTINAAPYVACRNAMVFFQENKFEESLAQLKIAINEFDKEKRVIAGPLFFGRVLFNNLDRQEERYNFYQEKLNYYLVNGPVENTAPCYHALGGYYIYKGNYDLAISNYLKGAEVFKKFSRDGYQNAMMVIGVEYANWGNFDKAAHYIKMALPWIRDKKAGSIAYALMALSNISLKQKDYQKAINYADEAIDSLSGKQLTRDYAISVLQKALVYLVQNRPENAYPFIIKSKSVSDTVATGEKIFNTSGALETDFAWYRYYNELHNYPAAQKSLLAAYNKAVQEKSNEFQLKYLRELSQFFTDRNQSSLAKIYLDRYFKLNDAQQNEQNSLKIAQYENEQKEHLQSEKINTLRQERVVQAAVISKSHIITAVSLIALVLISCAMFFIYRQYQGNKKTLSSLRKTQRQLIQSEKMASLGELTAGIAHEIQNPLNFVNNFSEVNSELIDEMQDEIYKGNLGEVKAIAADIKENELKIIMHGKRADSIVKSMLEHSRASSGQKELTDINGLADEYMRLSYHGLRAKDKSFNAAMDTRLDDSLPKVNLVSQDIGRVLLNLYNNAFYAVHQKKKQNPEGYIPQVTLTTANKGNFVEITVNDNGNGIPDDIKDKIMQPFFTTKPTGEGTGLGLSLSYDIVVKGHGGSLEIDSREKEYSIFIIKLPLNLTSIPV